MKKVDMVTTILVLQEEVKQLRRQNQLLRLDLKHTKESLSDAHADIEKLYDDFYYHSHNKQKKRLSEYIYKHV